MEVNQDRTWTIVKFLDDSSVAAVPTNWINNGYCLWPPFSLDKVTSAIRLHKTDTCWPSHKVQIFRNATYDSYEKAREKTRKAEDTSDLNTTDTDEYIKSQSKRKFFKKKLYSESDDSDESNNENESTLQNDLSSQKTKPKLPTPIKKGFSKYVLGETSKANARTNNASAEMLELDKSVNEAGQESRSVSHTVHRYKKVGSSLIEVKQNLSQSTLSSEVKDTKKCQCYCPSHAEFHSEILRQLYFLRSVTTELMAEIKNIKDLRGTQGDGTDLVLSQFKLPFNTEEELLELENFMKIAENFNKVEREVITGWKWTYELRQKMSGTDNNEPVSCSL